MLNDETMKMFEEFNLFIRQQQVEQRKEAFVTKALHFIVNNMDQFDRWNTSKYAHFYAREMELNRMTEHEMVESFKVFMVPKICGQVKELQESDGGSWGNLCKHWKKDFL